MESVFIIDLDRCFGCHACEVACKQENDLPVGPRPIQVVDVGPRRISGRIFRDFVPVPCFQCEKPNCLEICPAGAIWRGSDGTVLVDQEGCTGCSLCVQACLYGAISLHPDLSMAVKCDFCMGLTERGLDPACVSHCPANALMLVNETDFSVMASSRHSVRLGRVVYISTKWKLSLPYSGSGNREEIER
jgi:Fe-S-cluster-containing dehydrogenase component